MRRHLYASVLLPVVVLAAIAPACVRGASGDDTGFLPLSPTPQPANPVPLSPAEQLGKDLFFDTTLSNPAGYACASCHSPETGFSGPSSFINQALGPGPGVVFGRFGKRKSQAISYSGYSPRGPIYLADLQIWLGGNFWDGRATGLPEQARMPFLDANEMANTPVGPYPPHAGGHAPLVAQKVRAGKNATLFEEVNGPGSLDWPDAVIYSAVCDAITDYEASREVNRFNSKFDASPFTFPPQNGYMPSASELNGMNLFFGKAQCSECHSSATLGLVQVYSGGRDLFTMFCYANIGVPKNPSNPIYRQTQTDLDPDGANPAGFNFIDYGLGGNPNPSPAGMMFMNQVPGDIPQFRGLFRAPTVRNVDKRPNAGFVKSYMHNGVFKSLEDVVNFYNKRNIAVNAAGEEVAFDLRVGPPPGYTALFAPPEVLDNVQNAAGLKPSDVDDDPDVDDNGQVGNLGLTPTEVNALGNFLKILSDR